MAVMVGDGGKPLITAIQGNLVPNLSEAGKWQHKIT